MTLTEFLYSIYPGAKFNNKGWISIDCPLCPDGDDGSHLGLNPSINRYNCFRCGTSGKLSYFLHTMGHSVNSFMDSAEHNVTTKPKTFNKVKLPEEFIPLIELQYGKYYIVDAGLDYIHKRIGFELAFKLNVGYCLGGNYNHRIIVPNYSSEFDLEYFIARAVDPNTEPKVLNPYGDKNTIFNWNIASVFSEIYIMEGVFGAITTYPNGVALYGKNINEFQLLMLARSNVKLINIVLDGGAEEDAYKLADKLLSKTGKFRIKVIELGGDSQPDDFDYNTLINFKNNTNYYEGYRI